MADDSTEERKPPRLLSWINPRRMGKTRSVEFAESLPPTPLGQHLAQLHALFIHVGGTAPEHSNALSIFEHSLREIAAYTTNHDAALQHFIQRERPKRDG